MRIWVSTLIVASTLILTSFATERATIAGGVVDIAGKPIEHATVMVYSAAVKKGYSIFCPTCYTDCGKRTATDKEGKFAIGGLNPELLFTLLVVKERYAADYIWNADPAKGPTGATLKPAPVIDDVSRVARVKVVTATGRPVRDAVVQPDGPVTSTGPGGDYVWRF